MKGRNAVVQPSCSRRGAVVEPASSRHVAVVEPSSSRHVAVVEPSSSRHGGRHSAGDVEQLALLWLPDDAAGQPPDWLTGGETPAQRTNAIRGLHPTGRALGRGTNRCKGCRHRVKFDGYSKCALDQHRWTNARGTDIRARWRECSEWREGT